ncbi:MAG: twin-arginine translocase TatA/TatE family subunit [Planctomycetes bacterium]|nr:twin-arginine translocase TatA/TatE family subunit [Planctomycetota bacterium]
MTSLDPIFRPLFAIGMPGTGEMILIAGIILLLFGANKLPRLARSIGESITEFKKGVKGNDEDDKQLPGGDDPKKLPRD